MNLYNKQTPIESQTGPDDIIETATGKTEGEKDKVQEKLEGSAPSEDETKGPEESEISRSE